MRGQADAVAQWKRARATRDAALAVLDRYAMLACRAEENVADRENAIQELVDAATTMGTVHGEMQKLESIPVPQSQTAN